MQRLTRFDAGQGPVWGLENHGQLTPLVHQPPHLSTLIEKYWELEPDTSKADVAVETVRWLAPVTPPCMLYCQGVNYADHREETGRSAGKPDFNLIFSKADGSISTAIGEVVKPTRVSLLDYEIELGLVIGQQVSATDEVTVDNWTNYVAGLVVGNDISARDIQLSQGQWLKGKSFRTFAPLGPYLGVLEPGDAARFYDLELTLSVNGDVRQQATTQQLLFKPHETLAELAGMVDLRPGDVILTGTPGGVALKAPSPLKQRLGAILFSEQKRIAMFLKSQQKNPNYLNAGDQISATIKTSDGALDLGEQCLTVVDEADAAAS